MLRTLTTKILFLFLPLIFLASCSIYKMDIQQGNYVSENMLKQLKPNLTKIQVQKIMGSPTLVPVLDLDHWSYYYSLKPGTGEPTTKKSLTLFFKDDKLVSYQGDWKIDKLRKRN